MGDENESGSMTSSMGGGNDSNSTGTGSSSSSSSSNIAAITPATATATASLSDLPPSPNDIPIPLTVLSPTTTQPVAAPVAPPKPIQHNGLHPLHPRSSSASLSLAATEPHKEPDVYKVGQYLDVMDPLTGEWYEGRVTRRPAQGLHIHYTGWPDSADAIVPPSQSYQKKHLAPHRAHTTPWDDDSENAYSHRQQGGELLCCDREGCVKVWHLGCVGLRSVPKKQWICPECRQQGKAKKGGRRHVEERRDERKDKRQEERKESAAVKVKGLRLSIGGVTAIRREEVRRRSVDEDDEDAVLLHRVPRRRRSRQLQSTLADEVDEDDWPHETTVEKTREVKEVVREDAAEEEVIVMEDGDSRRERPRRVGVKWSLRPLVKKEQKDEQKNEVKFEDEDDEEVRRTEATYDSEHSDDEDYQLEDTPAEEESLEEEEDANASDRELAVEQEELLPDDEDEPMEYRRYRRQSDSPYDGGMGKKATGFGRAAKGKLRKRDSSQKRKRDVPERTAAKKKRRVDGEQRWDVDLPVDDEEAREELQQWMKTSRKRAVRDRPNDEWRYQQDDETLVEEGETEERAEREHDSAVKNEQSKQRQKQEEERMRRERMWNSSAIHAVLQQLDTLTLLRLVATTIERMGNDSRIRLLTAAAPSLQSLLSTVTASSIAEALSTAPSSSSAPFPPPQPSFSAFLSSLHRLVVASVNHHAAELHTYRFFILRSLDLQWRQYIHQHTQTINALWVQLEARERDERDIEDEMKAEQRVCEEWRKKFSLHWEVAQRMHDRLEAEERELREWSEWCETRRKEAEEDVEEVERVDEQKQEMDDTQLAVRREAAHEKSGMLIVALCMCLLMKWRAMGPIKDVRKAFDAIIAPTPPPTPPSLPSPAGAVAPALPLMDAAVAVDDMRSHALLDEVDAEEDNGYVNLDHTIVDSAELSPQHSAELDDTHQVDDEQLDDTAEHAYYDETEPMEDDHNHDGPVSPLHDGEHDEPMEEAGQSADEWHLDEQTSLTPTASRSPSPSRRWTVRRRRWS